MKRLLQTTSYSIAIFFLLLFFSGCLKDNVRYTYQISTPVYESLTAYRQSIKGANATSLVSSTKIATFGKYIFISESGKGIHVIDNSDPSNPKNISFINIPGNNDFAIRGNALYADAYGDLVTFDISDPANAIAKNFVSYAFPYNSIYYSPTTTNPDSISVIIGYTIKDTTVNYTPGNGNIYPVYYNGCANCYSLAPVPTAFANASNAAATGTNGSLSRFTIINNYLYSVDNSNLRSFSIGSAFAPSSTSQSQVDWHVETIYPFKNELFIGTNNGVYMYDVQSSPDSPSLIGEFTHLRGCDPVIADSNYAYVTLNDSSACLGFNDELQIVNIQDMSNSFLVKSYQLTHPIGLCKDGNYLFICDDRDGLKVFDASDVSNLMMIAQLKDAEVYDVIAQNNLAIVMAKNGIYQYDYSDISNIHLISKL